VPAPAVGSLNKFQIFTNGTFTAERLQPTADANRRKSAPGGSAVELLQRLSLEDDGQGLVEYTLTVGLLRWSFGWA
jgi:hypothetical protein